MLNILIPMAGTSIHFPETEFPYPKPLIELGSKTMIELVIENLSTSADEIQYIFIINEDDCFKFHLDHTLELITNNKCQIMRLGGETRGAACSALMAIEIIDEKIPLLIANYDQIFDFRIESILKYFENFDAGVITFNSIHPRWSYVRTDDKGYVLEAAEKKPISRNAIAGLYYYKSGFSFIQAAMQMIRKDENVNGKYFIAPTINQLILAGKIVVSKGINEADYHSFYTPKKLREYQEKTAYNKL